jgi:hypothetical protein
MIATNEQCQPPPEGERRKTAALDLLAARHALYVNRARRALLTRLLWWETATADAVRAGVELPPGLNPKLFGAVPAALVRAGIIAPDGFAKSARPQAHARPVQLWRLVNRSAALDWLRTHPDQPDPVPADRQVGLFDSVNNTAGAGTPAATKQKDISR